MADRRKAWPPSALAVDVLRGLLGRNRPRPLTTDMAERKYVNIEPGSAQLLDAVVRTHRARQRERMAPNIEAGVARIRHRARDRTVALGTGAIAIKPPVTH